MFNPITSYRAIVNGAVDVIPQGINAIAHSGGQVAQGQHAIGDVFTRFFAGKANAAAAAKQAAAIDTQAAELAKHLTVSGDDAQQLARQIIQQQHGGAGVAANGGHFQGQIQGTYSAAGGNAAGAGGYQTVNAANAHGVSYANGGQVYNAAHGGGYGVNTAAHNTGDLRELYYQKFELKEQAKELAKAKKHWAKDKGAFKALEAMTKKGAGYSKDMRHYISQQLVPMYEAKIARKIDSFMLPHQKTMLNRQIKSVKNGYATEVKNSRYSYT